MECVTSQTFHITDGHDHQNSLCLCPTLEGAPQDFCNITWCSALEGAPQDFISARPSVGLLRTSLTYHI